MTSKKKRLGEIRNTKIVNGVKFDKFSLNISCFQDEDEGWKMAPSNFVPALKEGTDTYTSTLTL